MEQGKAGCGKGEMRGWDEVRYEGKTYKKRDRTDLVEQKCIVKKNMKG